MDADRFSTGQSGLDLHAKDQSSHPRCCPEAVIWPLSAKDYILQLTVVMANGEIVMGTRSSKTSSGYDFIQLMVGSEGTLGIVVKATVRLTGFPPEFSARYIEPRENISMIV